jgi:F-box protein 9
LSTALDFYNAGISSEREGRLDEAIRHYRRAFKMDPSLASLKHGFAEKHHTTTTASTSTPYNDDTSFSDDIPPSFFITNEEEEDVPSAQVTIDKLPAEIIRSIFSSMEPATLERCARVKKHWFIISREPGLWRHFCMEMWDSCAPHHVARYKSWRRMFLERPRVHYDGIYISKNIYIRPGSTEGSYNQPVHQVVYYRYLRFYEDGGAISTLSFEDPKQVLEWFHIESDEETLRKKSRHVNVGSFLSDDEEGQVKVWVKGYPNLKHFMLLSLSTHGNGVHNRLTVMDYASSPASSDNYDSYHTININKYQFVRLPPHKLMAPVQNEV